MIYEAAIKKAFFYRYAFMFTDDYPKAARAAKASVREALSEVKKNKLISNKKIFVYTLMNFSRFCIISTESLAIQRCLHGKKTRESVIEGET